MFHVEHSKQIIMNTTENNKLIAEFMGFRSTNKCIRSETGRYYDYFAHPNFSCIEEQEIQIESENGWGLVELNFLFLENLKFHSSFDWLMPVALRILSSEFCLECDAKGIYPWRDATDEINGIKIALERGVEPLYEAVIAFITWYNEQ